MKKARKTTTKTTSAYRDTLAAMSERELCQEWDRVRYDLLNRTHGDIPPELAEKMTV